MFVIQRDHGAVLAQITNSLEKLFTNFLNRQSIEASKSSYHNCSAQHFHDTSHCGLNQAGWSALPFSFGTSVKTALTFQTVVTIYVATSFSKGATLEATKSLHISSRMKLLAVQGGFRWNRYELGYF